jgi:D-serine deaminase-like pyridoxal phosphate-dependent protein
MAPTLEDLDTPAVVVDLDVMERNVARMAERASAHGVRLRPHAKTHKTAEIARRQMESGAIGLSVAKTAEAEAFAAAGFDDLFVAYPVVGGEKGRRLLALADRCRISAGVDSVEGALTLGSVFAAAARLLDVLLKIDVGLHRVGVPPERALEVASRIADVPGLRLRGVFTHAGHAYAAPSIEAVASVGSAEGRILVETAEVLRSAGLPIDIVSAGSTPTAPHVMATRGLTECRPGNYVFHDASQVALGTCRLEDCALTILATVVSVPDPRRAVVDAGSKTLSSDPLWPRAGGHGILLGRRSRVQRLSEEHGVIDVEEGESFHVGERVAILPNHACVVANLHDRLLGVRGGRLEAQIPVLARGRIT